jgi:hypothetical protein
MRRPSQPFLGHQPSGSTSSLSHELRAPSSYAPSVYAQSTLAASTIMPGMAMQPVRSTETVRWQEGHCMQWRLHEEKASCSVCDEKSDEGLYRCNGKCIVFRYMMPRLILCRLQYVRTRQMRLADMRRMPYGLPSGSGTSIVCAMLRQPLVYVPPLPRPCVGGPTKVWYDISIQDGGVYEKHAA